MKICIFYTAALGNGHKKCAEVLEKKLKDGYDIKLIDSLKELKLNYLIGNSYFLILKYFSGFYGNIYLNEKKLFKKYSILKDFFLYLCSFRFKRIIEEEKPDLVICTQAFPCAVFSRIKKNYKLFAVITDFHLNSSWINKNVDYYAVSCNEIKKKLEEENIDKDKIKVTGIPVDVLNKTSKKKYILIMGGGAGLGDIESVVNKLKDNFQLKVVAGKNKGLKKRLEGKCKVYGFVDDIDNIYAESFLVITKPGGLTVSELLNIQLPMILLDPLPGQEEKNFEYLIKNKIAYKLNDDLIGLINKIISSNHEKIKDFSRPEAAVEVLHLINDLLKPFKEK